MNPDKPITFDEHQKLREENLRRQRIFMEAETIEKVKRDLADSYNDEGNHCKSRRNRKPSNFTRPKKKRKKSNKSHRS